MRQKKLHKYQTKLDMRLNVSYPFIFTIRSFHNSFHNKMISYKDFIKLMEGRGYTYNGLKSIYEYDPNVKTFPVKKGSVGKILELHCPNDAIISICGKNHPGGCEGNYSFSIKCFSEDNKEPFQDLHQCIALTATHHTVVDIVLTKILQRDIDKDDEKTKEWSILVNPILNLIGSKNANEHVMWSGNYKTFHKDFLNNSFNLYADEKIIFYAIRPDIDIDKILLDMKVDILERLQIINFKPLSL